jgi:hypothetical protein
MCVCPVCVFACAFLFVLSVFLPVHFFHVQTASLKYKQTKKAPLHGFESIIMGAYAMKTRELEGSGRHIGVKKAGRSLAIDCNML